MQRLAEGLSALALQGLSRACLPASFSALRALGSSQFIRGRYEPTKGHHAMEEEPATGPPRHVRAAAAGRPTPGCCLLPLACRNKGIFRHIPLGCVALLGLHQGQETSTLAVPAACRALQLCWSAAASSRRRCCPTGSTGTTARGCCRCERRPLPARILTAATCLPGWRWHLKLWHPHVATRSRLRQLPWAQPLAHAP